MAYNPEARRTYKAKAKAQIKQNFWPIMGTVIFGTVPLILISLILSIGMNQLPENEYPTLEQLISIYKYLAGFSVVSFLIGVPLEFGLKHYMVSRARDEEASFMQVLTCFTSLKKYWTSLKLSLCIAIRSLGWMLLMYFVMIVTMIPMFIAINTDDYILLAMILFLIWFILIIALALVVSVKIRRYDGAYIAMIDTPDASVWQAVKSCAPIFKGHNRELLMFDLSFIPWILLTVITLGIASIYVAAYTEIAFVHYFDDLCNKKTAPEIAEAPEL